MYNDHVLGKLCAKCLGFAWNKGCFNWSLIVEVKISSPIWLMWVHAAVTISGLTTGKKSVHLLSNFLAVTDRTSSCSGEQMFSPRIAKFCVFWLFDILTKYRSGLHFATPISFRSSIDFYSTLFSTSDKKTIHWPLPKWLDYTIRSNDAFFSSDTAVSGASSLYTGACTTPCAASAQ